MTHGSGRSNPDGIGLRSFHAAAKSVTKALGGQGMVYTRSNGVAQRNGGLGPPSPVKNYAFHSQANLHDWSLEEQARRGQEWRRDLEEGKRQRAGLTVGDIDGACPLQWDVNVPGVRQRAKAQRRTSLQHLEQPPAKRLPDHHQAARTARGGWTSKDAVDAQQRGLLVDPTGCLPPPHWKPTIPEGGLTSNAVIKQQFKYVPNEDLPRNERTKLRGVVTPAAPQVPYARSISSPGPFTRSWVWGPNDSADAVPRRQCLQALDPHT